MSYNIYFYILINLFFLSRNNNVNNIDVTSIVYVISVSQVIKASRRVPLLSEFLPTLG